MTEATTAIRDEHGSAQPGWLARPAAPRRPSRPAQNLTRVSASTILKPDASVSFFGPSRAVRTAAAGMSVR